MEECLNHFLEYMPSIKNCVVFNAAFLIENWLIMYIHKDIILIFLMIILI